jgi:hypothetical protein
MDVRTGSATLAKTSTSTLVAPARRSACAQSSTVAPDISRSSTRKEPAADDSRLAHWRYAECACMFVARSNRDLGGKQGRLVEGSRPAWNEGVGTGQNFVAGMAKLSPVHRRKIEPVAIISVHAPARGKMLSIRTTARTWYRRAGGDRFHGQEVVARIVVGCRVVRKLGRVMKESLDQPAGQSPCPLTGSGGAQAWQGESAALNNDARRVGNGAHEFIHSVALVSKLPGTERLSPPRTRGLRRETMQSWLTARRRRAR